MDADRLAAMANQIARNFEVHGESRAVEETAAHIREFWDPRMKSALLSGDRSGLSRIAAAAAERL